MLASLPCLQLFEEFKLNYFMTQKVRMQSWNVHLPETANCWPRSHPDYRWLSVVYLFISYVRSHFYSNRRFTHRGKKEPALLNEAKILQQMGDGSSYLMNELFSCSLCMGQAFFNLSQLSPNTNHKSNPPIVLSKTLNFGIPVLDKELFI